MIWFYYIKGRRCMHVGRDTVRRVRAATGRAYAEGVLLSKHVALEVQYEAA